MCSLASFVAQGIGLAIGAALDVKVKPATVILDSYILATTKLGVLFTSTV